MNTRWGKAGWGRTPATLRRHQAPPSFLHRHEPELEVEIARTFGDTRFASNDSDAEFESEVDSTFAALEPSA